MHLARFRRLLMHLVELFTGCGGLAYGLCEAGLRPIKMVEADPIAHETVAWNRAAGVRHVRNWPADHADVRTVDWRPFRGKASIVAGGPPCQPFSQAGKSAGKHDKRDMWPEAIRAVREIQPEAFLFENVRGLLRKNFEDYFLSVLSNLESASADGYKIVYTMVDAADYGAAQRRHRVIVAGFRRDLVGEVTLPLATHSKDRLLWDQWVTGAYWERHGINLPSENLIPKIDVGRVKRIKAAGRVPEGLPWRTVRDALVGLGEPNDANCHVFQGGARAYPGHTGSGLDQPAKALKAGMHGVPGGENMLRHSDGAVRYFTIREMARLQGFPDEFNLIGTWTHSTRQLGNAVPVALGYAFASWVVATLEGSRQMLVA